MSGQNRKMVIAYKQFLSTWCHPNERKVLGNVLLLYTGCLQHMKHTLGIRDQEGWNQCPEWGPGTKVGVPEKGKIKKEIKSFLNHF